MASKKDDPRVTRVHDEVIERVQNAALMSCTFSGRCRGEKPKHQRVSLRPVTVRDVRCLQMVCKDGSQSESSNVEPDAVVRTVRHLLSGGYSEIHVMTGEGDLHVKFSKKGRMMTSRSKPLEREVESDRPHDRSKRRPLDDAQADSFLRVAEILDPSGKIKPSMQGKFRQINEFLRILETVVEEGEGTLTILDCGCGRSFLLFAAYYFVRNVLKRDVRIVGVDKNPKVLATCRSWAERLDLDEFATFHESSISDFTPDVAPDVVMSLHACDTATDEALAGAVRWQAKAVLCAPCCQHELQKQIRNDGVLRGMLRHGILRERFADLLTDTFRAQLLRIMGYRVRVMEFVDSDATARNVMLRCERAVRPGHGDAVEEYRELREHWAVTPTLERLLGDDIRAFVEPTGE